MIAMFRKEMRKWHSVLWVVLACMVLSGVSFIAFRSPGEGEGAVAVINGHPVTIKQFRRSYADLQQRMETLREYSAMYGISFDMMLKSFFGSSDLTSLALENSIKDALVDDATKALNVQVDDDYFKNELVKGLPSGIIDEQGRINMDYYQGYLQRLSMTPKEFELAKEDECKRSVVNRAVAASFYAPAFALKETYMQEGAKKSFKFLALPRELFVDQVKKAGVSEEALKKFYEKHKESYRTPEKRRAQFAVLSPKDYEKTIELDEKSVQAFYDKNKATLYRVAPRIQVRRILIKAAGKADTKAAHDTAFKLNEELKANPDKFAQLAKEYSQDSATAANGGLTPMFNRGTYGEAFEKAAFRLKTPGEFSGVVKVEKGYELIRLEQRESGSEKPLDEVRSEIVAALKSKKALSGIKSDLEMMMHKAKTDEAAFNDFVAQHKLTMTQSDWLEADQKIQDPIITKLAERLFGRVAKNAGYFMADGNYVLFKADGVEDSVLPKLASIQKEVEADYLAQQAIDEQKDAAKNFKRDILEGKTTLGALAQERGLKLIESNLVEITGSVTGLPEKGSLVRKSFVLSDPQLLLEAKQGDDIYLVQLVNIELPGVDNFSEQKKGLQNQEKLRGAHGQMNGFIASLQRNAKITMNDQVFNANKSM